jgi:peptidoglycan/LPS O-acetylase OafA/YrhL
MTDGNSWSHFRPDLFSLSKILGLRPCRIMPLALSTLSLVCGCAMDAQSTQMWWSSQNSRNLKLVN